MHPTSMRIPPSNTHLNYSVACEILRIDWIYSERAQNARRRLTRRQFGYDDILHGLRAPLKGRISTLYLRPLPSCQPPPPPLCLSPHHRLRLLRNGCTPAQISYHLPLPFLFASFGFLCLSVLPFCSVSAVVSDVSDGITLFTRLSRFRRF